MGEDPCQRHAWLSVVAPVVTEYLADVIGSR
jgi:hypothetical protein